MAQDPLARLVRGLGVGPEHPPALAPAPGVVKLARDASPCRGSGPPTVPGALESRGFTQLKQVGKGAFGRAIVVQDGNGERLVAKEVDLGALSSGDRRLARREVKILQRLQHPNVVKYMNHFEEHGFLYILMEYADAGDLDHALKGMKDPWPEDRTVDIFRQICLGLSHVHARHIMHRDIKPANILLSQGRRVVKLGDFGISAILKSADASIQAQCGTPCYFSPELCQNQPYNTKSDVWAVGCLLYEMLMLKRPFDGKSMRGLMWNICKGAFPAVACHYSPKVRQLVTQILNRDPEKRPSILAVLEGLQAPASPSLLGPPPATPPGEEPAKPPTVLRRAPSPTPHLAGELLRLLPPAPSRTDAKAPGDPKALPGGWHGSHRHADPPANAAAKVQDAVPTAKPLELAARAPSPKPVDPRLRSPPEPHARPPPSPPTPAPTATPKAEREPPAGPAKAATPAVAAPPKDLGPALPDPALPRARPASTPGANPSPTPKPAQTPARGLPPPAVVPEAEAKRPPIAPKPVDVTAKAVSPTVLFPIPTNLPRDREAGSPVKVRSPSSEQSRPAPSPAPPTPAAPQPASPSPDVEARAATRRARSPIPARWDIVPPKASPLASPPPNPAAATPQSIAPVTRSPGTPPRPTRPDPAAHPQADGGRPTRQADPQDVLGPDIAVGLADLPVAPVRVTEMLRRQSLEGKDGDAKRPGSSLALAPKPWAGLPGETPGRLSAPGCSPATVDGRAAKQASKQPPGIGELRGARQAAAAAPPNLSPPAPVPAKQASPKAKAPARPPTTAFAETARAFPPPGGAVGSPCNGSPKRTSRSRTRRSPKFTAGERHPARQGSIATMAQRPASQPRPGPPAPAQGLASLMQLTRRRTSDGKLVGAPFPYGDGDSDDASDTAEAVVPAPAPAVGAGTEGTADGPPHRIVNGRLVGVPFDPSKWEVTLDDVPQRCLLDELLAETTASPAATTQTRSQAEAPFASSRQRRRVGVRPLQSALQPRPILAEMDRP